MKTTIKAILKTRSPLHIAHPDSIRMNGKGGMEYGDKGFPCTAVQKMRTPVASTAGKDGEQKDTNYNKAYPVIAGNNIAGRLRRHAALIVLKALKAKGQKLSLHAYSVLMCGASTGKPDSEDMTYAEYQASRKNAYFGLFGGGPKMFERRIRVHSSVPVTPSLTDLKGILAHPNAAEYTVNDSTRFTALWGFRRMDDLRDLMNMDMAQATVENFEVEFEKRQALILSDKPADKGDAPELDDAGAAIEKKSNRYSTKTYSAFEFVIPGVLFDLTMEADVATDAQMGLLMETLDSFVATERLGGAVRNGFGVFSLENVQISSEGGESISIFNNGRLNRSIPTVATWLKAWADEALAVSKDEIESMIAVKPKEEKPAKKSKAAVPA